MGVVWFWWGFFFLIKKAFQKNVKCYCITITMFWQFPKFEHFFNSSYFNVVFCKTIVFMSYWQTLKNFAGSLKWAQSPKFCISRRYIEFFFSLDWSCWELQVVCWQISFISYNFWDKLDLFYFEKEAKCGSNFDEVFSLNWL